MANLDWSQCSAVESVPGKGTTFHIYLPALAAVPAAPRPAAFINAPKGRGEMILVIDDDDGIRLIAERILATHGYEVCTAPDGETGLLEFERQRNRINLVICDQMMPGISGLDVLELIHRRAPKVGLITMSGLFDQASESSSRAGISIHSLPKPLKAEALLRTVRQVIDGVTA